MESLKNELSSVPFFSRVFYNNKKDKIIVWNDIDILQQYKMNESIDINIIMGDIKHKIEKKIQNRKQYSISNYSKLQ
jgi:metallophosphoesterase superfamily enzyme